MGNTYLRIKSRKQEKWRRQKVHEPRAHQSIVVGKPQLCCHSNFRTWILKDSTTLGVEAHFIKNERMCHSTLATMEWVSKCIPIKNLNTKQKSKITQRDVIWKPSWYVAICHQTVLFRPLNDHNNDMTGQFLNCEIMYVQDQSARLSLINAGSLMQSHSANGNGQMSSFTQ